MNARHISRRAGPAALAAWAAFAVLAAVVAEGGGAPLWPDGGLLSWSQTHRPAQALALARAVTSTGTGIIPCALAVLAGLVAGRTAGHRLRAAVVCVAVLAVGQSLRYGVMTWIHRARPPAADWATHASGYAFPSGHTTTAAVTAGLLIIAVSLRVPRGAVLFRLVIGCWGALVGLTRVYLGVHWFTDVVGGWLFATGWVGLWVWAAARWLPGLFASDTAPAPEESVEGHAPQDPCR
jgi:undecaprenyl-diphosphatase